MSPESPTLSSVTVSFRVISAIGDGKSSLLYLLRRRHPGDPGMIRNRSRDDTPSYFLGSDYQGIDRGNNALVQSPIRALILYRPSIVVLVVSAETGPTSETLLQLRLVRLLGIDTILTVITKSDRVSDNQLDRTVFGTRMALSNEGYPADDMPILFASLQPDQFPDVHNDDQNRLVDEIVEELDRISPSYAEELKPTLIRVMEIYSSHPEGLAIRGRVEQGKVIPEQTLEIVGGKHRENRVLTRLSGRLKDLQKQYDGFLLLAPPINRSDVERGMFLTASGSMIFVKRFRCVGLWNDTVKTSSGLNPEPIRVFVSIWNIGHFASLIVQQTFSEQDIGSFQVAEVILDRKVPIQMGWEIQVGFTGIYWETGRIIEILSD
jgi:hypothetical protein